MILYAEPVYFGNEEAYVADAMKSKWISGGEYVDKFEQSLEKHFEQPVVTVSNGTAALELAYISLCFIDRPNIIVPAFGFMAAANVASNLGIEVKFADVLPNTWVLDPKDVERKIDKHTRAIVAIHTYGNICDMYALREIARAHKLDLIEDCAESMFSTYWCMEAGTIGDVGTFSFHATKTLTTGEGGMVTTHMVGLDKFLRVIRNHGMETRGSYNHIFYGMNFRMPNLQAAIGLAQMEHKAEIKQKKINIGLSYRAKLLLHNVILQAFTMDCSPVFWTTGVKLDNSFPERDEVIFRMMENGIEIRPGFVSPSFLPIYEDNNTPVADDLSKRVISLPCGLSLTEDNIGYICEKLLACKK